MRRAAAVLVYATVPATPAGHCSAMLQRSWRHASPALNTAPPPPHSCHLIVQQPGVVELTIGYHLLEGKQVRAAWPGGWRSGTCQGRCRQDQQPQLQINHLQP